LTSYWNWRCGILFLFQKVEHCSEQYSTGLFGEHDSAGQYSTVPAGLHPRPRSNAIDVFVTQSPDKADTNQNSHLFKITYTGVHWKASFRTLQPSHHKHASRGFSSPPPTFVTVTAGLYPPPRANAIDVFVTQSPNKADTNQNSHLFNHTYTGVHWKTSFRPLQLTSPHDHSPSQPLTPFTGPSEAARSYR
jgi:hypothetical protein